MNLCIKDIRMHISFFIIHEEKGDGKANKMQLHLLLKCFVQKPRLHLSAKLGCERVREIMQTFVQNQSQGIPYLFPGYNYYNQFQDGSFSLMRQPTI